MNTMSGEQQTSSSSAYFAPQQLIKEEPRTVTPSDDGEACAPTTSSETNGKVPTLAKKLAVKCKSESALIVAADMATKWTPPLWKEQLARIKDMRSSQDAPVDTMGCDADLTKSSAAAASMAPPVRRFHVLVSLMLSAQTRDEVTAKAMQQLHTLPLTIDTVLATDADALAKLIYPVSFYKRKAEYIRRTSQVLKDQFASDIPASVDELCMLPGVGPKMAYIAMTCAWDQTVGIGVDTHVHRIANRLGWVSKTTRTPEHTRKELQDWLPENYWKEINHLLVGFGQQTCRPIGPKCDTCLCKDICPAVKLKATSPNKSAIKQKKKSSSTSKLLPSQGGDIKNHDENE